MLNEVPVNLKRLMAGFRFLCLFCISFLLLNPLIKTLKREIEKPVIIIAQDNSASIITGKDSAFYKKTYPSKIQSLADKLNGDFDVQLLSFGDGIKNGISSDYKFKQTDISQLFEEISVNQSNKNIGAVIIASDGLYNQGANPLYSSEKIKSPIYTIALGDTTEHKDLYISRVNFNRIAYLGNTFPLEILVDAKKCQGNNVKLTVSREKETVFQKDIQITSGSFHSIIPVVLEAKAKGIQHYKITVSSLDGEMSRNNNFKDVYIEVLENKQKIAILSNSSHPDIAAIKEAIETSNNYEVKLASINNFTGSLKEYNLIILHQIPGENFNASPVLTKIKESGVPVWYIIGAQTSIGIFNSMETGVIIEGNNTKTSEILPKFNEAFSLFTIDEPTKEAVKSFPPLIAPFASYKNSRGGYNLFTQQIGSVSSDQPLLTFFQETDKRNAVLVGNGLWRWRMYDYSKNGNTNAFNEIILKTIQYLSVREQKTRFKVISKANFNENEPIEFNAELYNESYELINTPDVSLKITNSDEKSFPFTFSKTDKAYSLNAGYFPVGDYQYEASVKLGDKNYSHKGQFSISPLQLEFTETTADHRLLYTLAKNHSGEMFYPADIDKIAEIIKKRNDIKAISWSEQKLEDMINLKWLFFLLMIFLSGEWFLRKRYGAY